LKLKVLFLSLLLCVSAVQAQSTASKKDLITKILQLQRPGIEQIGRGLVEQPAAQMMQQAATVLQTRIPADKREALGKEIEGDIKKYVDSAVPVAREQAVRLAPTTIGAVLDEKFTEDELRQIVAVMESPAWGKYQRMQGEMLKSLSDKLVADIRGVIEPKVRALDQTVGTRLGLQPRPAGAGAPAAPARAPARAASN